jgi:hypothetical protein
MKTTRLILSILVSVFLVECSEPLPLKVGVCKDDVCANIETVIPARKEAALRSGKEVQPVQ